MTYEWVNHLAYPPRPQPDVLDIDGAQQRHVEELLRSIEARPDESELEESGIRKRHYSRLRWITQLGSGIVFILLGIMGLIFPVMPGWIFIFIGLPLIAGVVPPLRRAISRGLQRRGAQKAIDKVVSGGLSRAAMVKALQSDLVRQGLDGEARWMILHRLLDASTSDADTPSAEVTTHDE